MFPLKQVLHSLELALQRGDLTPAQITDEALAGFFSDYGRKFYGLPPATRKIKLIRDAAQIPESLKGENGTEIVPFLAGGRIWGVEWL